VVFIPKCRRKTLYGNCGGTWVKCYASWRSRKESRIEEGHVMPHHVDMMIAIPPKYALSQVAEFIKGKSAIHLARVYGTRNFVGNIFWARGYWVLTVGRDEAVIREYIRNQEKKRPSSGPDQSVALGSHR